MTPLVERALAWLPVLGVAAMTFVALVIVGLIKGKLARINLLRSIAEIVVVGVVSAGGGYLLGNVIPGWLGLG